MSADRGLSTGPRQDSVETSAVLSKERTRFRADFSGLAQPVLRLGRTPPESLSYSHRRSITSVRTSRYRTERLTVQRVGTTSPELRLFSC